MARSWAPSRGLVTLGAQVAPEVRDRYTDLAFRHERTLAEEVRAALLSHLMGGDFAIPSSGSAVIICERYEFSPLFGRALQRATLSATERLVAWVLAHEIDKQGTSRIHVALSDVAQWASVSERTTRRALARLVEEGLLVTASYGSTLIVQAIIPTPIAEVAT